MKLVHPNLMHAAAMLVFAAALGASGCHNQQNGTMGNPFLAPNRVPPPGTRALLPGQAQPYYPGDPLPAMQSGQPAAANAVAANSADQMPSATQGLSWAAPRPAGTVAPASATVAQQAAPANVVAAPAAKTVAANEPSIAVPADGGTLRFEPAPIAATEPRPFAPSGPVVAAQPPAASQPTYAPAQQPQVAPQPATQPPAENVAQTAFTEPVVTEASTAPMNPWRSPQITQQAAVPAAAPMPYPQPYAFQPAEQSAIAAPPLYPMEAPSMPAPATMDVTLRAVAPPPGSGVATIPRIRIPGYDDTTPLIGSNDGFRPRTSMR